MEKDFGWVTAHINDNPAQLRLKYSGKIPAADLDWAIRQIECRQKFGKKLAGTLLLCPDFDFPSVLSGEQSTSDALAEFHTSLLPEATTSLADITAGLGIDAMHMAKHAGNVTAIEITPETATALESNAKACGLQNIKVINTSAENFLDLARTRYDVLFIDPHRRHDDGSRAYALADCRPSVPELIPLIKEKAKSLIVKASPMLDITHTLASLGESVCISQIIAVGTATECKEVVVCAQTDATGADNALIRAVTIGSNGDTISDFRFTRSQEQQSTLPSPSMPIAGGYICEPSPQIMKTAPWKLLASKYGLGTFNPNTHLYHCATATEDFPGRCFQIIEILPYASKYIKRVKSRFPALKITARNFDISADALRSKLGVRDGGNHRMFAITGPGNQKYMIITLDK